MKALRHPRYYVLLFMSISLCIAAWYLSGTTIAFAQSPPAIEPYRPAETFVLEQVAKGELADLETNFPDESDRELRADFIEQLLTGTLTGVSVQRQEVRIRHAVFVEAINLENAEIPYEIWLDDCRFEASLNLVNSFFHKNLSFDGSRLNNEAYFNSTTVGGPAFFNKAVFARPVDFGYADIAGNFEATEAQFTNPEQEAKFNSITVGAFALFNTAIFTTSVDVGQGDSTGTFEMNEPQFAHAEQMVDFSSMTVEQNGLVCKTIFAGPVSMADANFFDLVIQGPRASCPEDRPSDLPRLDLSRTVIKRGLRIEALKLQDLIATSLHVEGPADLNRLTIENEAKLDHSSFVNVTLSDVSWPAPESFELGGMTYQHISAGSGRASPEKLLDLASQAAYNAQVYTDLEAFFRQQGEIEWADNVFIARKQRERDEKLPWYTLAHWGNRFLEGFVNYGRGPGRVFYWSALFLAIGYFVFRRKEDMQPQKAEDACRDYHPL